MSSRLLRSIPHPDRKSSLPIVTFNPAGQVIVSGYPSGVIQVLDPRTGKELRSFETQRGYRGSLNFLQVSADLKTAFVGIDDDKFEPIPVGDKKTYFRRFNGETRVYDLDTGTARKPLRVEPPRGVISLTPSPDGTRLGTMEFTSGLSADFDKLRAMYLWDVEKRTAVKLRAGHGDTKFSPDGKTVYVVVDDYDKKTGSVYAHSVATGKELFKRENQEGYWGSLTFAPAGTVAARPRLDAKAKQLAVEILNPATLATEATLTAATAAGAVTYGHLTFSTDGTRLAAVAGATVYLWDVPGRKLVRSWPLDTLGRVWRLAMDADGRRLAAGTWHVPPELQNARDEAVQPEDYPQPKVFLIEAAAEKAEAIVCPHGWWGRPAFSPDGTLLAVGGAGATHVFDVGKR